MNHNIFIGKFDWRISVVYLNKLEIPLLLTPFKFSCRDGLKYRINKIRFKCSRVGFIAYFSEVCFEMCSIQLLANDFLVLLCEFHNNSTI